ncbi:MAG: GAF domain-containing sensor histidine kinase [Anaerolineales bacterium]|nr:GAF domain-containing sensor histidine kinase [Anaerolineales bacterium]
MFYIAFALIRGYTEYMDTSETSSVEPSLRQMAEQLARLIEISVTLNSTLDEEELLQFIINTATELLDCETVSILLYDETQGRLVFSAATGSDPQRLAEIPVPIDSSIAGLIFRENRAIVLNDVQNDPRHFPLVARHVDFETRSLIGVPMRIKDQLIGVLEALNKKSGGFTDSDVDLLNIIASQAAVSIYNARLVSDLRDAYAEINAANQLKTNFLALASHELRTPLGIIIGYATFLQEEAQGELSDHARQVLNAALQMRSLVDAMTNLNMLRAREMVLHRLTLPIQKILQKAYQDSKLLAEAKNQKVTLALPGPALLVDVDPEKLNLVLVNLMHNAARFTPENGHITLGAMEDEGKVLVWVQDDGIGIPVKDVKKIFQEFYQADSHMTRRYGGLGLGLTIAQGIIESHAGHIWAESEGAGKGACFKVTLPLIRG